jgi:hypothetical protein
MFVRIKKSKKAFRLSLADTKRVSGKVKHEHIASLGSIRQTMTVAERSWFWAKLRERLPGLANRIDAARLEALIAEKIPVPTKIETDVADLEEYTRQWQGIANFFRPHEFKVSEFRKAMHEMSEGLKQREHQNALARVSMAKDRIQRVLNGEDAGLKKPFSVHDPAYRDAGEKMACTVTGKYLIDEAQLHDICSKHAEEGCEEMEREQTAKARFDAKVKKRSEAARRGWQNRFDPEYIPPIRYGQIFRRATGSGQP